MAPMALAMHRPSEDSYAEGSRPTLFVADREMHVLSVYNMDGDFLRRIGSKGNGAGQFVEPLGLAVHAERIFVAEGLGARLQVLTLDGQPLCILPSPGNARLCGLACHGDRLFVTELLAHRLHAFKLDFSGWQPPPLSAAVGRRGRAALRFESTLR